MAGRLKSLEDIDFSKMTITVVNETPGSTRRINREELPGEIRRMGGGKLADYMEGKA